MCVEQAQSRLMRVGAAVVLVVLMRTVVRDNGDCIPEGKKEREGRHEIMVK